MHSNIVIVGEAFGEKEEEAGRPFVGPSGGMLNSFLSAHGISRGECYLTNVFNFRPPGNRIPELCGGKAEGIPGMPSIEASKYILAKYKPELDRLYTEIRNVNPNVVVALGGTAAWALLHDARIKKLRGSPLRGVTGHKVLPTYHPAAVLREYKLRPIVFADFGKIRKESAFPDIRRPVREFWLYPTLDDIRSFERHIYDKGVAALSVDIETWNRQITCVGFAPSIDRALVIPFVTRAHKDGNYWRTLSEELTAWSYVRKWLGAGIPVVGQNFAYDLGYLWRRYGIRLNEPKPGYNLPILNDTMLTHHAQQPEMEKSLALLTTLYTEEPQHKFMRASTTTLKKED